MKHGTVRAAILLTGIFLATLAHAQGAPAAPRGITVYVNRVVTAAQGDVSLGALVRSSGPLSPSAQEALSRCVTVLGNAVQLLPASQYQQWIEAAFGPDAIIVGARTILIPKGTSAESQAYALDRVADYLVTQKLVGDSKTDMSFTQGSSTGTPPQDGTPSCQVITSVRGVEVSFLLTGSSGSVSGRVTLAADAAAAAQIGAQADARAGVKSSSPVRVLFRRGPITVEVPGKALGTASVGDNVRVSITESQKTFTGRLVEGKAVQVDLP